MKVKGWRIEEAFGRAREIAIEEAGLIMDDVVAIAKGRCPVGTVTRVPGDVSVRHLRFTPKRRGGVSIPESKRKEVAFTVKHWTGRIPGSLRDSIRRVTKPSRPGNLRVYAGHFKVPYAHFVEYGTVNMDPQSFMRPTFAEIKGTVKPRIESAMAEVARYYR